MRKPIIAGNWKMNNTISEAVTLIDELRALVKGEKDVEIVVAPTFTALSEAAQALADSNIKLSAQDMYWEEKGA